MSLKEDLTELAMEKKGLHTIFRSSNKHNLSLTKAGFEFVKEIKYFDDIFEYKIPTNCKPSDVIKINKVFKDTPFYYDSSKNILHHFDLMFLVQSGFYGDRFSRLLDDNI